MQDGNPIYIQNNLPELSLESAGILLIIRQLYNFAFAYDAVVEFIFLESNLDFALILIHDTCTSVDVVNSYGLYINCILMNK